MSNTEKDNEFYEMADAFIALANQQSKNVGMGKTSATFLYAAARFNSFVAASESNSAEEYALNKKSSLDYFLSEYKKMLEEHFADYHENFAKYLPEKDKSLN